jgi:thiol:disulfide interchange protein DsbA
MHSNSSLLRLLAAIFVLALAVTNAQAQLTAGRDYQLINPPQPTESGSKIEVIEFFSYGCPHCYTLQAPLRAWLKRKPADVEFRRMPAVFQDSMLPLARIYYTLDAMGLIEKLHHDVFTAVHDQKVRLNDTKVLFDWVATKGVDRQKFIDTYNSFTVQSRSKMAGEITRRYDVPFTPALVVHGRFLTGPSMTATGNTLDYDRFFKALEEMIAMARKSKPGK